MNAHAFPPVGFDADLIRTHVALIHERAAGVDGLVVLSAFGGDPLTGREETFPVERFSIGDVGEMVDAIMRLETRQHANAYVGLQVMRRDLPPKARGGLKDIVAVLGLVADFDGGDGKGASQMPLPPSLVLETSPGNRQCFLFFDKPMNCRLRYPHG
jgi:hypothetical protein